MSAVHPFSGLPGNPAKVLQPGLGKLRRELEMNSLFRTVGHVPAITGQWHGNGWAQGLNGFRHGVKGDDNA
jgi:hypothetical protein